MGWMSQSLTLPSRNGRDFRSIEGPRRGMGAIKFFFQMGVTPPATLRPFARLAESVDVTTDDGQKGAKNGEVSKVLQRKL